MLQRSSCNMAVMIRRAGVPDGVAQRDARPADVDLVVIATVPCIEHRQYLRGEGFVDLDAGHVSNVRPVRLNSLRTTGTGPRPMLAGSQQAAAQSIR